MKKIIYLILSFSLFGCWPCHTIMIENGALPDSALKLIPYVDGEIYRFKHSNGLVIDYKATRETSVEYSTCAECCKYGHIYEVNTTTMTPNYPIFSFQLRIDNQDTLNISSYTSIGKYGFIIPTNNELYADYQELVDSVKIDSIYYYQVFKLKSFYDNYNSGDLINVDSIYYSYDKGIIKIILSNNETYTLYE